MDMDMDMDMSFFHDPSNELFWKSNGTDTIAPFSLRFEITDTSPRGPDGKAGQ